MTFQPVIAGPGIVGWQFLQRTYDSQFEAFNRSPQLQRDDDYFLENISSVTTAEDLVADRRLLGIVLGAFGLQNDIDNRFFIRKILEDGTSDPDALANRLADERYKDFSETLRLGPGETPATLNPAKMQELIELNRTQSFEIAVGESDDTMRIALYAQREIGKIAREDSSDEAKWFKVMALPPLRQMFETALGLPQGFGQIDIDKQREVFEDRTRSFTGNAAVSQFTDPEALKRITELYLARAQVNTFNNSTSSAANALQLLQFSA